MLRLSSPFLAAAAALALLNAFVVVALWSPSGIHDAASLLTGLGRVDRAAGRVPRARPAAAAGAHPGARARPPRALPPLERLRVPGAAAGACRADHGRVHARRRHLAARAGRAADHRLPRSDHRDRGAGGADRRDGDLDRDRAPPAALRDLVLRAPVRLPRRGAGVQPPARDRQRLRRRPGGARVLVRAVRRHARLAGRVPAGAAARPQRLAPAAGGARGRRGAGRGLARDRRRAARSAEGAHRPVLHVALRDPQSLVGGAPVLALGGAGRAPAADHGQGARRPHALAA